MELCQEFWKRNGIWLQMQAKRPIYCERKGKSSEVMNAYYDSIDKGKGAIFMAVLRGKVSEGVDFTDMYGRATIIVGVPFANARDVKIENKKAYMNAKQFLDRNALSGGEWYVLDAVRAVNQAIGRVIRHKNDYGAILLFDYRFNEKNIKRFISTWVKESFDNELFNFCQMAEELKQFFARSEARVSELMKFYFDSLF